MKKRVLRDSLAAKKIKGLWKKVNISAKVFWTCSDCGTTERSSEWCHQYQVLKNEFRFIGAYCPNCHTGGLLAGAPK
jgi:hypothetical protein